MTQENTLENSGNDDLEDLGFEASDVEDNTVEWIEVRDDVESHIIALCATCVEVGALQAESRIREVGRSLLDIVFQKYGMGD